MKKYIVSMALLLMGFMSLPAFCQNEKEPEALGLPGDNLDLYAVLNLFQKSKTIEDFEKSLNEQKTGINNMDLDLDKKVDFIKVVTKQKDQSFQFILQIAVSEKETQDVAVILVDKDKNAKATLQIVGDKELYGPNYIVEPGKSAVTANPAYTGAEPVKESTPATTTTVVVEQVPIVQYVYSPVYVPYYPPYHYGYYPPYYAAFTVMAVGVYRHNHYHYHHGGYGYHNTTVIHNTNNFNNYNNSRNTSNRVSHNNASGRYSDGNRGSASSRPSAGTSDRPSGGGSASTRPSAGTSDRPSGGASASTRPSAGTSDRSSSGASASNRQSSSSMESGRTRSSGGSSYGGGGGGYGGGGGGGGMSRGGGRRR